jgi:hypothetical protein
MRKTDPMLTRADKAAILRFPRAPQRKTLPIAIKNIASATRLTAHRIDTTADVESRTPIS